jgi:DNA invertase Pin-like site-specific DNA recombinase
MTHVAIYTRVSTDGQSVGSQLPELEKWAAAQTDPVEWYTDKFSGKTMNRPGWDKLWCQILLGNVARIVVWRLDRLGRSVSELSRLFEEMLARGVSLVSVRDGLDLGTASGRLHANILASMAQFEREVIGERIKAGLDAARAKGQRVGGSEPGRKTKLKPSVEASLLSMFGRVSITEAATVLGLSRTTVYGFYQRKGLLNTKVVSK